MNFPELLPYAKSSKQRETLNALIAHGSSRKAAEAMGCSKANVNYTLARVRKYAEQYQNAPEYKRTKEVPEPFIADRLTTAYNKDGEVERQWVKVKADKTHQLDNIKAWIDDVVLELPKYEPSPKPEDTPYQDLMAVYPLGDPHVGMAAYMNEAGVDWDLVKTEESYLAVFDRLVQTAPHCEEAVIVNLGDYFHADNIAGVTTRSGHHLDMDSNYESMVDIGMKIMLRMIHSALQHHKKVRVINAVGNHDDTGSIFLQVALKHMFMNEPRVIIEVTSGPYNFVRFGKNLFGVHHGHTTKADKLPLVMATDKAKDWGETEFRYWYTGHIHHDTLKEYTGCTVETFRTLSAKDAYATWGGYRSGRDSKAIILHKDFGEIERHTINIAQIGS